MRIVILILFIAFMPCTLYSQDPKEGLEILRVERKLHDLFDQLYAMDNSPARDSLNQEIIEMYSNALKTWDGFHNQWNSLENIGRVFSEDKRVKAISWNLQNNPGEYEYYGIIAFKLDRKRKRKLDKDFAVVLLKDNSAKIKDPETRKLNAENWYGCVYYRIKTFRHKKDNWYALLGYDFNDGFSSKKLIEIVSFNRKGQLEFGGVFIDKNEEKQRMVFEYSSQVSMSLQYDERLNMFVYDHLSPFEPIFRGSYRFYGPDGSYDGIRFEKGVFFIEEDVDARNY